MNIIKLRRTDAVNGPGVRCSIWTAGCVNRCEGCWAVNTWDPNQGTPYRTIRGEILEAIQSPFVRGVSLLGGDPFYWVLETDDQDIFDLLGMLQGTNTWCWTGYTYEQIMESPRGREALQAIDVLVDGRFDIALRDVKLRFRGSSNQRMVEIPSGKNVTNKYNE